jgi:hypothetical protein
MKTEAYRRAEAAELVFSCCAAVYLNGNGPGFNKFCADRMLRAGMIENSNAAACVFSNAAVIIAVVRGTDDLADWKMNFKTRKRTYIGAGKVSSGFGTYFGLIRRSLIAEINAEFNRNPRPVYIGGHSLGATSAVYLAIELCKTGIPFEICAICGGPRPGDKDFCAHADELLAGRLIQVRRKGDCVPCVPPYLAGYRHLRSHLAYIDVFGLFRPNLGAFWQFTNRATVIASTHISLSGLRMGRIVVKEDHSADAYAADVRRTLDCASKKATAWAAFKIDLLSSAKGPGQSGGCSRLTTMDHIATGNPLPQRTHNCKVAEQVEKRKDEKSIVLSRRKKPPRKNNH